MPKPNTIQTAITTNPQKTAQEKGQQIAKQTLNAAIAAMLDKEGLQKRFYELLGKRTPQFMSSLVALLNSTPDLMQAWNEAPMTVIQAALRAASYDLPIDPMLGFAYLVAFNNNKIKPPKKEAVFLLGYKGMIQLALRTGVYQTINVLDIREGELINYNRLTEEIELQFIEDDDEREQTKIIGYVGYFKLLTGTEKKIYMSIKQIEAHERKHRKGEHRGKGWRDDYAGMCAKTVLRRLIGKWGIMSIDYQQASPQTIAAAEALAAGRLDDEDEVFLIPEEVEIIDIPTTPQEEQSQ
jgi:recombination protein RecT